jgi:uncharacterized protein YndB with AHSA1/START domain
MTEATPTTPTALPYELERTVRIAASPEIVFEYFTDSTRWAAWWGAGSTIDARVGGAVLIRSPNAPEAIGTVEEIDPPRRIVFTMGYRSGKPFPPGASRVTISLRATADGTCLHLVHAAADAGARDEYVQGWRYQLSLFANLVLDSINADANGLADRWFAAVSEGDAAVRASRLSALAAPHIEYRDRYSCISGIDDLVPQIDAMHRFMAGFSVRRKGVARHRQGAILVDWVQAGPGGSPAGEGGGVIELDPAGRVSRVTMF